MLGFLSDAGCGTPRADRPSNLALRAFVTTLAWVSAGRACEFFDSEFCLHVSEVCVHFMSLFYHQR